MKLPPAVYKPRIWLIVSAAAHSASWSTDDSMQDGEKVTLVVCNVSCHVDWFFVPATIERRTRSTQSIIGDVRLSVHGALPSMLAGYLHASTLTSAFVHGLKKPDPLADALQHALNTLVRYRPAILEYDSEAGVLNLTDFGVVALCRPGITAYRLALESSP